MLEGQWKSCRGDSGPELKMLKTTAVLSLSKDFITVFFCSVWQKDTNAESVGSKPAFQLWETGPLTVLVVLLAGTVLCPASLV